MVVHANEQVALYTLHYISMVFCNLHCIHYITLVWYFVTCTVYICFLSVLLAVSCGTPRSIPNGQRSYSRTTYGSTVTYTCDTGYAMTAGSSTITCQSNGQWPRPPTCSRKSKVCCLSNSTLAESHY